MKFIICDICNTEKPSKYFEDCPPCHICKKYYCDFCLRTQIKNIKDQTTRLKYEIALGYDINCCYQCFKNVYYLKGPQ